MEAQVLGWEECRRVSSRWEVVEAPVVAEPMDKGQGHLAPLRHALALVEAVALEDI